MIVDRNLPTLPYDSTAVKSSLYEKGSSTSKIHMEPRRTTVDRASKRFEETVFQRTFANKSNKSYRLSISAVREHNILHGLESTGYCEKVIFGTKALLLCISMTEELSEFCLLNLRFSVSQEASLGDFLLAPTCPIEKVTLWEGFLYLSLGFETYET